MENKPPATPAMMRDRIVGSIIHSVGITILATNHLSFLEKVSTTDPGTGLNDPLVLVSTVSATLTVAAALLAILRSLLYGRGVVLSTAAVFGAMGTFMLLSVTAVVQPDWGFTSTLSMATFGLGHFFIARHKMPFLVARRSAE